MAQPRIITRLRPLTCSGARLLSVHIEKVQAAERKSVRRVSRPIDDDVHCVEGSFERSAIPLACEAKKFERMKMPYCSGDNRWRRRRDLQCSAEHVEPSVAITLTR
jgi:hypothetical protein